MTINLECRGLRHVFAKVDRYGYWIITVCGLKVAFYEPTYTEDPVNCLACLGAQ